MYFNPNSMTIKSDVKEVPHRIRVKTLITSGFIFYSSILLALFEKKVVPPVFMLALFLVPR